MLNKIAAGISGALLCFAVSAPALRAQDKPNQGDTKVVIKDDTTPKVKKGAKAVSDGTITTEVKTRLMKDKAARATSIDVDTKDGVVTIGGSVPTAADKARIGRLVAHTTGVKRVENDLTVAGAAAGTTGKDDKDLKIVVKDDTTPAVKKGATAVKNGASKTADAVSDGSVTTAVKTRLMKDSVARGTHIDVDTNDGVVTIAGTVPTEADKVRIGQLVEHTTGVKSVVNNLTVGK